MVTSKSAIMVAQMALRAARDALPDYARLRSPKKFTQPQLVACRIVKEFQGKDYRGIHVMLSEWSAGCPGTGPCPTLHHAFAPDAAKVRRGRSAPASSPTTWPSCYGW